MCDRGESRGQKDESACVTEEKVEGRQGGEGEALHACGMWWGRVRARSKDE